ncbi:hypothetical protein BofuT4_uP150270.1 [Botrytis cinerea T4]|uniref:Uncharacterized protein n=1 Tax=Botryotinia fuckeliana (strain T4) TaxID=999810 RepID=G2YW97_BOTF4|nr:hypothetical protein BofuT4_uP150270.1 [Botrytis cinerea T4]
MDKGIEKAKKTLLRLEDSCYIITVACRLVLCVLYLPMLCSVDVEIMARICRVQNMWEDVTEGCTKRSRV